MITWHFFSFFLTRNWSVSVNLHSVIQLNDEMFTIQRFSKKGLQIIFKKKYSSSSASLPLEVFFVGAPAVSNI